DYIDRQFHALGVWDHVLEPVDDEELTPTQPEFRHRTETLRRIAAAWRAAGEDATWQFGTFFVAVPRALLTGSYVAVPVRAATGETI
ncbi:hypothetical protein J8J40_30115, partial [Mycobacterium tuberculosis]|nr:hypothetical protein [Mycobacterium tuberculosis]